MTGLKLIIPNIVSDYVAVSIIDELKFKIKTRQKQEGNSIPPIITALDQALNRVIHQYGLDWDPHSFARWPLSKKQK